MRPRYDARAIALDLLNSVLRRRRPLDEAWVAALARGPLASLEARDRAFARLLVATTLRRLGEIDAALDRCLERPLPARARRLHDVLRLGAVQLLFLGTKAHAAVDSAVRLVPNDARAKGLVNALLRRLAREGPAAGAEDAARNTPEWLWRSWSAHYGEATAAAIAAAHLAEPPLDITLKAQDAESRQAWAARLEARVLPTGTLRRATVAVDALAGFAGGAWWVQDAAAALPARLLGDVAGRAVIDLCAAPGGKTAQLAAAGARVVALDRSPKRLALLRANLARLGLEAECVLADARAWRPGAPADAVLLDAPCSATGTLRRHPDIAHLRSPADVASLAEAQAGLLESAAAMVAPGGTLIYAACSLEPEEGVRHIEAVLAAGSLARAPIAAREIDGQTALLSAEGDLRTLPHQWPEWGGLDGFFAARLRKAG